MPVKIELTAPRRRLFRATYRRSLPASIEEVPEKRRLRLWRALLSAPGEAGRIRALRLLLDLPNRIFRQLDADNIAAMLAALQWLQADPNPVPALTRFRYRGRHYFFPDAHGMNLMAIEYPIADEAFMDYLRTGNPDALRLLCGALLREQEPDEQAAIRRGDRRVPLLTRAQAQHRAEGFKRLPDHIQSACLLYFAGVKEFVHTSYGKVLFEDTDTDEQGNPIVKSTSPSLGWWSVYFNVAQDGPFGKIEEVYQTSFHDVCLYLVERIRAQKEMEMKSKLSRTDFARD